MSATWKPIETAPKSLGQSILVWCPRYQNIYAVAWGNGRWYVFGANFTELSAAQVPTHWMPLPEPPTT